jgi:hypothetical protein
MSELKRIQKESIPRALEKAERYRLLNQPFLAESICLDVLATDDENHAARVCLVLCLADQLGQGTGGTETRAREEIARLAGEYERAYYAGIVSERLGYALLHASGHGSRAAAYHFIADAMECYDKAHGMSPAGNDDATLRWNTCVRLIRRHRLEAPADEHQEYPLE